ncbi:MAG: DegV family protein [Metamycoplasmataceae bacterium]
MKKLAIVLDSFSGLYKKDIEKENQNIYFLSLQVEIENKVIQEGIEVPSEELINKIRDGVKTSTSLPSLAFMQDMIKKLSSEYQKVIFLPIPTYMSGTSSTLAAFAKDYKNVTIFNNHFVGNTSFEVAKQCIKMIESNSNFDQVISYIKKIDDMSIGYVVPSELKSIINSGRLKGVKKHLITAGNFSLIIKVFDKLALSGISRSRKSAIRKTFAKLEKFCLENKIKEGYVYKIVYGYEDTLLKIAKEYIKENSLELAFEMKTSLSTFVHTGYGSIYIGVTPKIG